MPGGNKYLKPIAPFGEQKDLTMTTEEKMLMLFKRIHGEMTGACSAAIIVEDNEPVAVACMKNGQICWSATKADLVFDWITILMEDS